MGKCWKLLTWLDVYFIENPLRAIQLDTDLEDLMMFKDVLQETWEQGCWPSTADPVQKEMKDNWR